MRLETGSGDKLSVSYKAAKMIMDIEAMLLMIQTSFR